MIKEIKIESLKDTFTFHESDTGNITRTRHADVPVRFSYTTDSGESHSFVIEDDKVSETLRDLLLALWDQQK